MLGRLVKIFTIVALLKSSLFAVSDLDPKYLRLFTNENGDGIWQMVGVAGFYNNIYGVEYDNDVNGEYTSFYCESNTEDSIIRTQSSLDSPNSDMIDKYWLFSISVSSNLDDSLSPIVVDIAESNINCESIQKWGNSTPSTDLFIKTATSSSPVIDFKYPNSGTSLSVVFSLNYDGSKIYEVDMIKNGGTTLTLDEDLIASTDASRIENMSVAKQPIDEIIDLYLNDNPGFGGADSNYSNYDRDGRDYHSNNHQVPIDEENFISKNSELKIYSYDNSRKEWLLYNSINENQSSNEFTELQAGKGYWMKYDFDVKNNQSFFLKTLDLNASCGLGCESNFTITSTTGLNTPKKYNFPDSDIDSITAVLDETNISNEVNISAIKTADNSVMIVAQTVSKPTITETTVGKDIFLNIGTGTHSFWSTKDIKSGLVLGDSSIVLTSQSVYSTIAQQGWNLLTLPTSSIRRAVTGLIVDWSATNGYTDFNITDEFGVNEISMNPLLPINDINASESAKRINRSILESQMSGELSSNSFNVRAIPIGETNEKMLFISDDRFIISTSSTFGSITDLNGKQLTNAETIASSNYGEYALMIQPNLASQFVIDGNGQLEVNGNKIDISEDSNISTLVTLIESKTDVKAYAIDHNFDGLINSDGSDYILLTSTSAISVKDTTYTKVYSYTKNSQGEISVHLFDGTDISAELKTVLIAKDTNLSATLNATDFNSTYKDIKVLSYILDINGSASIDENETEYIVIVSTDSSTVILRESVSEMNITKDSLKEVQYYENNVTSSGAILSGIQANELASATIIYNIDSSGIASSATGKINFTPTVSNITANAFITDDLLASNSLITLSKAFSGDTKYIPTMIIGSESDVSTGIIHWKTLSPVQKVSNWYSKYNLFSTNNQKSYWVYLDEYTTADENHIVILSGDTVEEIEQPSVTKKYIRTFDNELNTSNNFFNITPTVTVKGVTVDEDNSVIADESSVYVVANLVGVSDSLEKLDFKMPMSLSSETTAPLVDGTMSFSTDIRSSDVMELNNSLTTIRITATDGRLYTDEYNISVDVKKPSKPAIAFQKDTLSVMESTVLYITSGDIGTVDSEGTSLDDTVKYLIFKDRIDDINGTAFTENGDIPSNFIMSVDKDSGKNGITGLCQSSIFSETKNLDFASLVIVALDNEDTFQANFSDMSKLNFIPMQGVHVLVHNSVDADKSNQPYVYDDSCVGTGDFISENTGKLSDSGIYLRSFSGEITLTYKPLATSTTTEIPYPIFVGITSGISIAKIDYKSLYVGKNYFIYKDGNIYQGEFFDKTTSNFYDNDKNPYILKLVSSSGQTIGQ